jgi:hypothetical protein
LTTWTFGEPETRDGSTDRFAQSPESPMTVPAAQSERESITAAVGSLSRSLSF